MPGPGVVAEVEGKLLADSARGLSAIAQLSSIGPYLLRELPPERLHTVYLDTPNRILAEHAVALRVRRNARRWEMTAKWAGHVYGDVHERAELSVPLPHAPRMPLKVEDERLRLHLGAILLGRAVLPVLVTDIRRQRRLVCRRGGPPDARPIAEIALDHVRLRAPGQRKAVDAYFEVEVERVEARGDEVARITEALRSMFDLHPSTESKYGRGVRLLYGVDPSAHGETGLKADEAVETALRKVVAVHLRALRDNDPGARLGEDPEAVHDMRVASRRLRAAVRMFGQAIPARSAEALCGELRWLRQCLGPVRDIDVQIQGVEAAIAALPSGHRRALQSYAEHLRGERAELRTPMLRALDSKRYRTLLLRLESLALGARRRRPSPAAREAVDGLGRRALQKALRRLLKRGKAIGDERPTPEDLHALRIRAKQLRYVLEFLLDLTGKPGRRSVRRLVRLQDVLGAYHDRVVAADHVRRYVERQGAQLTPADLLSLGTVAGTDLQIAEQSRTEFAKTWRRFTRKRARRDFRMLLERLQGSEKPAAPRTNRRTPTIASAAGGRVRGTGQGG